MPADLKFLLGKKACTDLEHFFKTLPKYEKRNKK